MKFRNRKEQMPAVELTPLIDVVFLLLIFFMISTTFVSRSGLQVRIPEAESSQANPDTARVEVMVTADGGYLVEGKELAPDADLANILRQHTDAESPPLLVIRADRNARHKAVVAAMDAGSSAGLSRVAIAATPPHPGSQP